MNTIFDFLCMRKPKFEYVCPPLCEFSASGFPIIVLNPFARGQVTGLVLGGAGNFRLSWNAFPGALCYTIYRSTTVDGEYEIVAECVNGDPECPTCPTGPDPHIDIEPFGEGCYRVSAITTDGESELSDPICSPGGGPGDFVWEFEWREVGSSGLDCPTCSPVWPADYLAQLSADFGPCNLAFPGNANTLCDASDFTDFFRWQAFLGVPQNVGSTFANLGSGVSHATLVGSPNLEVLYLRARVVGPVTVQVTFNWTNPSVGTFQIGATDTPSFYGPGTSLFGPTMDPNVVNDAGGGSGSVTETYNIPAGKIAFIGVHLFFGGAVGPADVNITASAN